MYLSLKDYKKRSCINKIRFLLVFLFFPAISSYGNDLAARLGCLLASIELHKTLIFSTMRAPIRYFDSTPVGRLLSRFSKDIDVVDTNLPQQISDTVYCYCGVNEYFIFFINFF